MWKQLLELAKRLFMLAEDTKRNRDEIKEVREEVATNFICQTLDHRTEPTASAIEKNTSENN